LISLLVLPIGWLQFRALPRTRWAVGLAVVNLLLLYVPWAAAVLDAPDRRWEAAPVSAGSLLCAVAVLLMATAGPAILRVRGQMEGHPQQLVTSGPFHWTRHPLYVGHALLLSGCALGAGARGVFLETPLLWLLAAAAAMAEERTRLAPRFGDTFREYRERTPFLLSAWAWCGWAALYAWAWRWAPA
jgi:protein-S-isoprenylcysteine O-methyltransferase Ste14